MDFSDNQSRVGGVVMDPWKEEPNSLDDEITHYQKMSSEEIELELRQSGIEPAKAVAAVKELIRLKLEKKSALK